MKCPVCKTRRCTPVNLEENLVAAGCDGCGGHWLSHKNYAAWLDKHGDTLEEKPYSEVEFDVNDVQDAKLCPECGRILMKYNVGHGLDFFVDQCPGCNGVWLDRNEWNALEDRNLHDEIHKMFSTAWQKQVRGESMAEQLDKVYANRLGTEAYDKAKEVREWLHEHPQKQALIAFLSEDDPYRM